MCYLGSCCNCLSQESKALAFETNLVLSLSNLLRVHFLEREMIVAFALKVNLEVSHYFPQDLLLFTYLINSNDFSVTN